MYGDETIGWKRGRYSTARLRTPSDNTGGTWRVLYQVVGEQRPEDRYMGVAIFFRQRVPSWALLFPKDATILWPTSSWTTQKAIVLQAGMPKSLRAMIRGL
jgi:hypothetical protein